MVPIMQSNKKNLKKIHLELFFLTSCIYSKTIKQDNITACTPCISYSHRKSSQSCLCHGCATCCRHDNGCARYKSARPALNSDRSWPRHSCASCASGQMDVTPPRRRSRSRCRRRSFQFSRHGAAHRPPFSAALM